MRKVSDKEMIAGGYNLDLPSDRERCALGLPPLTFPVFLTRSESRAWDRTGRLPKGLIQALEDEFHTTTPEV